MADERDRAYAAERRRQALRLTAIQRDTAAEVTRLLAEALKEIRAELASTPEPGSWRAHHLPALERTVARALETVRRDATAAMTGGADRAWRAGVELVDAPIAAALPDLRLAAILPDIDVRQLTAMKTFMTTRIRDISLRTANRVNGELARVAIGTATQGQAATRIARIVGGGPGSFARGRAITIIRTELGRAYAAAGQARQEQASAVLPGLKKQWRRSGKLHSRPEHDAADGQIRAVDEPFLVGGVALMYPRDPAAPAHATINCGCGSLPIMESWEVRQPGRQPFTGAELARRAERRARELDLGPAVVNPPGPEVLERMPEDATARELEWIRQRTGMAPADL